ncbi:MAG: helix-turn-helix domain-containing protein [Limnohabitans sp.]
MRHSGQPGQARTLQIANRRALMHLGSQIDITNDPKGRVIRQLRIQFEVDPSLLATQACMSLSQLYELESGGVSRFYSESLRRQAGRRVARLLGTDWDCIALEDTNNTFCKLTGMNWQDPVQWPMQAATVTTAFKGNLAQLPSEIHSTDGSQISKPFAKDASNDAVTTSMDLDSQENNLILADSTKLQPQSINELSAHKSPAWFTLLTLLIVVATGATGGYIFAEYSPYRFYWPL